MKECQLVQWQDPCLGSAVLPGERLPGHVTFPSLDLNLPM